LEVFLALWKAAPKLNPPWAGKDKIIKVNRRILYSITEEYIDKRWEVFTIDLRKSDHGSAVGERELQGL